MKTSGITISTTHSGITSAVSNVRNKEYTATLTFTPSNNAVGSLDYTISYLVESLVDDTDNDDVYSY
jgi:hypothetical protein